MACVVGYGEEGLTAAIVEIGVCETIDVCVELEEGSVEAVWRDEPIADIVCVGVYVLVKEGEGVFDSDGVGIRVKDGVDVSDIEFEGEFDSLSLNSLWLSPPPMGMDGSDQVTFKNRLTSSKRMKLIHFLLF